MSSIEQSEPPTTAKVILNTSYGKLEMDLWCKEAPRACKNFLQLAIQEYYTGSTFHRVTPGFIVQGGIPQDGNESTIYANNPFPVEIHSRLHFDRRGIVATAITDASGKKVQGSQFFITLDAAKDLQRKHTIFGKIVGDSVFNLLKIGETDLDKNERPIFPPVIESIEIVSCPFEDLNALHKTRKERKLDMDNSPCESVASKRSARDLNLLSFEDATSEIKPEPIASKSKDVLITEPSKPFNGETRQDDLPVKELPQVKNSVIDEIERIKREIIQLGTQRQNENSIKKSKPSALQQLRESFLKSHSSHPTSQRRNEDFMIEQMGRFKDKIHSLESTEQKESREKVQSATNKASLSNSCSVHNITNCHSCSKIQSSVHYEENWMQHKLEFNK